MTMGRTTVGYLKELIQDLPDDMRIVTSGYDHSYRMVLPEVVKAEFGKHCELFEYYEGCMEDENNPVKEVLLFT